MNKKLVACAAAFCAVGCANTADYRLKEVGSFHVGGRQVSLSGLAEREIRLTPSAPAMRVNPNGDFETGQVYVQYVRLAAPRARYPLLLWHGGGLTGVTWETKPDGAPGWQQYFLQQGPEAAHRSGPISRRFAVCGCYRRPSGPACAGHPGELPHAHDGPQLRSSGCPRPGLDAGRGTHEVNLLRIRLQGLASTPPAIDRGEQYIP